MVCILLDIPGMWNNIVPIAQVSTAMVAIVGLLYTIAKNRRDNYYTELDKIYFDLLKIRIEKPYLMTWTSTLTPGQQQEYDSYAYMIWNFIETITDRSKGITKKSLRKTWRPTIEAENAQHREWFNKKENRSKFKHAFRDFIDKEFPNP